ncbi:hypothetical protein TMU01_21680 [Tenuibacillus multivorans]|nr:hypothetical protein TMU01_21680 [Tenuibacillus multivorans]
MIFLSAQIYEIKDGKCEDNKYPIAFNSINFLLKQPPKSACSRIG